MTSELHQLAKLIREKNRADQEIAKSLGRPGLAGNIGEFVAAKIFHIDLEVSGSHAGSDGTFLEPPLSGKTVNVKAYGRDERILDISDHPCDYYLVMTGPPGPAKDRPFVIDSVYLFETAVLIPKLRERGVKIGVATSLRKSDWEAARILPTHPAAPLQLTEDQIADLALFRTSGSD